ncbi:radical SAM protein [Burkholderia stagnalis]|uniref:radical SAM protein n=1 Tax=Burkholderia stagnalis TaxID=1503054 RepID=UPI000759E5C3|nr:radical SAM protein [Burkholderia stagnalis]KVC59105.1 radical SAM protein [Burkholderia stagnalis]KVN21952.1 radical SAM protein [Burkholderia stagnalis]KWI65432.1 radical SAM protein [Burkholderia stagnalis]KWK15236.1 radical SAM protein [Burkholderia stagnalis]KWK50809.1 radical SAM protein [Burkholderia stagnalis]
MIETREIKTRRKALIAERLPDLLALDPALAQRFNEVRRFSSLVRASEYHLTNACNIRCKGCWFFEFGHDKHAQEAKSIDAWRAFIAAERKRRVNCALLIGGEPTLFRDRIEAFVDGMRYVSISTNGLKPLPNVAPFENVTVFISLFGGGPLDDELRAIRPGGGRFEGLFDTALDNYRNDPRATFVFAATEDGLSYIEPTVRRIRDNGNVVTFNFYSKYDTGHPLRMENQRRLLAEMLRVAQAYPDTVLNHPAHIEAIVTGRAWCGEFGYDVCPSVSQDHPGNAERLTNGNAALPMFNTWKPDLQTVELCCTSGHCNDCRDSQAVYSWLMVSLDKSLDSLDALRTWVGVAESYWKQFIWSPYRQTIGARAPEAGALPVADEPQMEEVRA